MNVIVVDCFDSFTFNLVHYLEQMCDRVDCIRCDRIEVAELYKYDGILLSPGPGLPDEMGNLQNILKEWESRKPILGICLGHQAIGTYYGLDLINMPNVHHGVGRQTSIVDSNESLFKGVPNGFSSARYHSWVISQPKQDSDIKLTAVDSNGAVMGISHTKYNVKGLQFHPESILTECGFKILKNWVESL